MKRGLVAIVFTIALLVNTGLANTLDGGIVTLDGGIVTFDGGIVTLALRVLTGGIVT